MKEGRRNTASELNDMLRKVFGGLPRGIVFDCDGVLVDSEAANLAYYGMLRRELSLPPLTEDDVHAVMGMTMKEISRVLQPMMNEEARGKTFERCCRYEVEYLYDHPGELYPLLRETLEELRTAGYELAIVSNCQRGYVEGFLHGSGLGDLFTDFEEWERTGLTKGENIRLVMERNGYQKAVYVGDTRKDQEAARAAGIPFVHAAYGFGEAEDPDGVIQAFSDLPAQLAVLNNKKQD